MLIKTALFSTLIQQMGAYIRGGGGGGGGGWDLKPEFYGISFSARQVGVKLTLSSLNVFF